MRDAGKIIKYGLFLVLAMGVMSYGCSGPSAAIKERPSGELAKVENISVSDGGERTAVLIELDKPANFTTVRVDDPPTVLVEIAGVDMNGNTGTVNVGKNPVISIDKSFDAKVNHIGRVGINLNGPALSDVSIEGSTIVVLLDKVDGMVQVPSASVDEGVKVAEVAAGTEPAPVAETVDAVSEETAAAVETPAEPVMGEATMVHEVLVGGDADSPYVAIRGDGMFGSTKAFMLDYDDNIRLVVDVFGVDSYTDKDTIVADGGLIKRVRIAAHDDADKKLRVVVDLKSKAEYEMRPAGGDIVIALAPEGKTPVVADLGTSPYVSYGTFADSKPAAAPAKSMEVAREVSIDTKMDTGREITVSAETPANSGRKAVDLYVAQVDGKTILSSSPLPGGVATNENYAAKPGAVETKYKVYTGGKISFDLQDAELDKVIQLLADVAGLNLLMNPAEVKGNVTLKLQNVPWDQAMDILLRLYDLDMVLEGNVLRVAPSAKLTAEEKRLLKDKQELTKLMQDAQDLYTKTFKVSYVDAETLQGKVKKVLSKRGEITANESTNELIVTDILDNINQVEDLINLLDKRVNQIMIEARIVTVDTGFTQSLGLSWGINQLRDPTLQDSTAWGVASGSNSALEFDDASGDFQLALGDIGKDIAGLATGMTWIMSSDKLIALDVTLSALETISKSETLAAPKVLTLENEKAQITQGTVLYVQTTSASGTKPEPLNANLSLTVTPRVTGDNYIMMEVKATNNTAGNPPPGSTASINTQAVDTNVIVKDGDTVVLGGIYTKTDTNGDSQVPWLGRIPLLGWLFKERTVNDSTKELLIFITPKIVKQSSYEA